MTTLGHDHSSAAPSAPTPERRARLNRRARNLARGLVLYNVTECAVSVAAGRFAGSVALVGFGLDSAVEVLSGLVIIWQFRHETPERFERRALRLIAAAFFALAAYVGIESAISLFTGDVASPSPVGIAVAVASIAIMPTVSWVQRRTGEELGSASVVADSKQVLLCAAMSATLLVGLAGNSLFGWWWLDPAVGLVIAASAVHEGLETLEGSDGHEEEDETHAAE